MSNRPEYVELRTRSAFSFLEGATSPEDLIECAAALGYDALALGDRDGLYGAPRFYHAAVRAKLKALVGAELTLDATAFADSFADAPVAGGTVTHPNRADNGCENHKPDGCRYAEPIAL